LGGISKQMRNRNFIKGFLAFVAVLFIGVLIIVARLSNMENPDVSRAPHYPYFRPTERLMARYLKLPKGTKRTYEESFLKEDEEQQRFLLTLLKELKINDKNQIK